tara:strand:- start:183 stop:1013 length:831 start_codon:yes stop_codon:yes gene_type:complete
MNDQEKIDYFKIPEIYKYNEDGTCPETPERFLRAFDNNKKLATKRWRKTLQWRLKAKIDENIKINNKIITRSHILNKPHTFFDSMRKYYPAYMHNRSKNGSVIQIEQIGNVDHKLLSDQGITNDMVLWHYLYLYEWQWNHLTPSETMQNLTIYDVKGLTLKGIILDNALGLAKKLATIFAKHYVERAYKAFIINVSPKFMTVWNIVKSFIPKENLEKVQLIGEKEVFPELLAEIDEDKLPVEYGGSDYTPLGMSSEEIAVSKFVKNRFNDENLFKI